jgi:DNA (cytosine-5)-methyltransferase 1
VENVAALAFRGLDRVLGDLAAIGYDAEWHCIPASAVGARHRRDRLWIVAYPRSARLEGLWCPFGISASQPFLGVGRALANTDSGRCRGSDGGEVQQPRGAEAVSASETMADATRERRGEARRYSKRPTQRPSGSGAALADAECWGLSAWDEQYDKGHPIFFTERSSERGWDQVGETWRVEPDLGRVAYGVPNAMDRIKSLGNAVVPQIPEIIGRAILQAEGIAA